MHNAANVLSLRTCRTSRVVIFVAWAHLVQVDVLERAWGERLARGQEFQRHALEAEHRIQHQRKGDFLHKVTRFLIAGMPHHMMFQAFSFWARRSRCDATERLWGQRLQEREAACSQAAIMQRQRRETVLQAVAVAFSSNSLGSFRLYVFGLWARLVRANVSERVWNCNW